MDSDNNNWIITLLVVAFVLFAAWSLLHPIYRRFFAPEKPGLRRFPIDSRKIVIEGPAWAVIEAHNEDEETHIVGFHNNVDHRNQVEVTEWDKRYWWSLWLYSRRWRREAHAVRAEHFERACQILEARQRNGLPITVNANTPMTRAERRITEQSERNRELDLYERGLLYRPPRRKFKFFGPYVDDVVKVEPRQEPPQIPPTRQIAVNRAKPQDRRPRPNPRKK